MSASRFRASLGVTGIWPGGPSGGSSSHSGRPRQMSKDRFCPVRGVAPSAVIAARPQLQPPCCMASASPAESECLSACPSERSLSSRRAIATIVTHSAGRPLGSSSWSHAARPRTVGRQNRAGWTKANRSSRSKAGKAIGAQPPRRRSAMADQRAGLDPLRRFGQRQLLDLAVGRQPGGVARGQSQGADIGQDDSGRGGISRGLYHNLGIGLRSD